MGISKPLITTRGCAGAHTGRIDAYGSRGIASASVCASVSRATELAGGAAHSHEPGTRSPAVIEKSSKPRPLPTTICTPASFEEALQQRLGLGGQRQKVLVQSPFGGAVTGLPVSLFAGENVWMGFERLISELLQGFANVDTYYFSATLKGTLHIGNGFVWDINYANSDNKANQTFYNGYNLINMKIALGDVHVCNATPGCVPLDLFGGQGRPITQAMLNYIRATQLDSSDEKLQLASANITGDLFHIEDRAAGFAVGAEHRKYDAAFNPDPLRQTGASQDSLAFPVGAGYHVNEAYAEFNFPLLASLATSAAVRYSDYSTFGGDTTGKLGFRWQPIKDLGLRGTYSKGFRAPNLGELYGLTQFGPTLVDPCGPTTGAVVTGPAVTPLQKACVAQGVPVGYVQANTQITSFTGGNAALQPEKSDSYTFGFQHKASWAESAFTDKLAIESSYYHHKITGAIQAADLQSLLNGCIAAGGTGSILCQPFSRQPSGNLNPPKNFLQNFGEIQTGGVDVKVDWSGTSNPWGRLAASLQLTYVSSYKAIDGFGNVSQRQPGIEVSDSSIPRIRANSQLAWGLGDWKLSYILRYIHSVEEACSNAPVTGVPGCATSAGFHTLDAVVYNDVQVDWSDALKLKGLNLALGVNNLFGQNPPICYTCTLNGYDAGTYDLPGAFWNVRANYKF